MYALFKAYTLVTIRKYLFGVFLEKIDREKEKSIPYTQIFQSTIIISSNCVPQLEDITLYDMHI